MGLFFEALNTNVPSTFSDLLEAWASSVSSVSCVCHEAGQ